MLGLITAAWLVGVTIACYIVTVKTLTCHRQIKALRKSQCQEDEV